MRRTFFCSIVAATWFCAIFARPAKLLHSQTAPQAGNIVGANPQAGTLNATLWMRTAGEYRALCLQSFRLSLGSLKQIHAAVAASSDKPLAVVMDLDETVLDNSLFQSGVILRGEYFSDEAFNRWIRERQEDVALVPGAKAFIEAAVGMGCKVHFVTNRPEAERDCTAATLRRLGAAAGDDVEHRLWMRKDTSLKDPRRAAIAANHRILMLVGDNLADFSDEFNPKHFSKSSDPVGERLAAVEKRSDKWGVEWIVLPNPVYGDWTKPIDWKDPRGALIRK